MEDSNSGKRFTHAVVEFVNEQYENQNVADLIPINWIDEDGKSCSYPQKGQYKYLEKWVKKSKAVQASWLNSQKINIIKKSTSYEKGLARLKRYLKTLDAGETTASEGVQDREDVRSNILQVIKKKTEEGSHTESNKSKEKDESLENNSEIEIKMALMKLHSKLRDQMKVIHDRIEYDLEKTLQQFENKVLLNIGRPLGKGLTEDLNQLEVNFPISELNIFESFDNSLSTNLEKQIALKTVMRSYARTKKTSSEILRAILSKIIEKSVQIQYSGEGKKKGAVEAKKSFNTTCTFKCMSDVIINLLGDSVSEKDIRQQTGKWLKGAHDRNGGRKARSIRNPLL